MFIKEVRRKRGWGENPWNRVDPYVVSTEAGVLANDYPAIEFRWRELTPDDVTWMTSRLDKDQCTAAWANQYAAQSLTRGVIRTREDQRG